MISIEDRLMSFVVHIHKAQRRLLTRFTHSLTHSRNLFFLLKNYQPKLEQNHALISIRTRNLQDRSRGHKYLIHEARCLSSYPEGH